MNTKEAAAAYRIIAEGFLHLAAAIDPASPSVRAQGEAAGRAVVAPARPDNDEWLPPLEVLDDQGDPVPLVSQVAKPVAKLEDQAPEGSLTQCPRHHRPYTAGKFGPYCTAPTDDLEWAGKPKPDGTMFCAITPKNVDKWLRQHSGVPA